MIKESFLQKFTKDNGMMSSEISKLHGGIPICKMCLYTQNDYFSFLIFFPWWSQLEKCQADVEENELLSRSMYRLAPRIFNIHTSKLKRDVRKYYKFIDLYLLIQSLNIWSLQLLFQNNEIRIENCYLAFIKVSFQMVVDHVELSQFFWRVEQSER